jgi:hypothetical protein
MGKHFRRKLLAKFKLTGINRNKNRLNLVKAYLLIQLLLFAGLPVIQEISAQSIFPNLSGQVLLDSLVANYRPAFTLDYTTARDLMFGILDNHEDSVSCVYTGYTVFVDHTLPDPHTIAYNQGLDTEHTWPQSYGATGQAKSDLHHLYPTRTVANSARGNLPFNYILTNQVDQWFRLNVVTTIPPVQFVEEYSKVKLNVEFEPRLDHKGNVARSIFYFYTMYSAQSVEDFFLIQKDILRYWNSLDPPDAAEILRSDVIATYQDGKANPFVLDTTLIGRAYFGVTSIRPGNSPKEAPENYLLVSNYPNPFNNSTVISINLPRAGRVQTEIFNLTGQSVETLRSEMVNAGYHKIFPNCDSWASGVYLVEVRFENYRQVHKMILLR